MLKGAVLVESKQVEEVTVPERPFMPRLVEEDLRH
jgi:hypothetical protein